MATDLPDDEIRVGTPERERAVALLGEAFAAGYLAPDEFEQRSGQAYAARTRGELKQTLHALPSADMLFPHAGAASAHSTTPMTGQLLALDADWSTVRRKGRWEVPSHVSATLDWGTLVLDFSMAHFLAPVTELALQGSVSTVKLKLGPDHAVRTDRLNLSGWSEVKDKAGEPRSAGGPTIVLTGNLSGSSAVVIRRV